MKFYWFIANFLFPFFFIKRWEIKEIGCSFGVPIFVKYTYKIGYRKYEKVFKLSCKSHVEGKTL